MNESRGAMSFTPLFTTDDIGLQKDASLEHVVKVFLTVGEAIAARWIEMPRGILLLQRCPTRMLRARFTSTTGTAISSSLSTSLKGRTTR